MMNLPAYDELHVISDLHMGGAPGFQILGETARLAAFVRWVRGQRPDGQVALLLNGDVVDTLAEDIQGYLAIETAVATVERIIDRDPAFSPIWDALAEFVRTKNRTLVIVIGNHDLEVALPPVQRLLVSRLAGDDPAARGRLEFSTFGAGYTCLVGGVRVFCTHGNEVDAWNYVRYEDLARVSRRLNSGRPVALSEWEPNAGTKMGKDVMNEVKRRYAWLDLLQPESQAAVGVLAVLEPSLASRITRVIPVVGERVRGGADYEGRLSSEGYAPPAAGATRVVKHAPRAGHRHGRQPLLFQLRHLDPADAVHRRHAQGHGVVQADLRRAGRRSDEYHRRRHVQRGAAGAEPDERGVHQGRRWPRGRPAGSRGGWEPGVPPGHAAVREELTWLRSATSSWNCSGRAPRTTSSFHR